MNQDATTLRAALDDRTMQVAVLLDALRERDRADAAQREWDFALQLQTAGLPNEFPAFPDRPEFDIRGGMVTAFEVGGDIYDFFRLGERHLAFVVADASGKGLPAAMFITEMRTILRAAAHRLADPGDCLTLVNRLLCFDNPGLMFVTAFYGVLDMETGEVAFANAGHNPPIHVARDGQTAPVKHASSPMLGAIETLRYRSRTLILAPGDTLCCFSDGITEANDTSMALFGELRLREVLASGSALPLPALEAAVVGAVDRFIGSATVADDLTLLLLRWNGATGS